jgi:flavin reductase (DIM6/NTAB) family NADH-FMN oxidoreductase RutF
MRLHLTNAGAITLLDASNFKKLDVLVDPQPRERLDQAVARIGQRDGDEHILLAPSVLRFLSGHAGDAAWEAGFTAMIDYAARFGWVNERGEVRAHITLNDSDDVVSLADFKAAMRALPAGISAITTGSGESVAGMIVSSLTSISAEPPLVGFFVNQSSSMRAPLIASGRFVANVLGEEHAAVMGKFLGAPQGPQRFTEGCWSDGQHGLPVLTDALASLECDIVCTQALGTHDLVVGKIRKTANREANPMVNFNASTHKLVQFTLH